MVTPSLVLFYIVGALTLGGALGVVMTRNIVYAAFALLASQSPSPTAEIDTFVLTNRGPVFIVPLRLPGQSERGTGLEEKSLDLIASARRIFSRAFPDRKTMRIGLVRSLMFGTGKTPCLPLLANEAEFAGANLTGGKSTLTYQDDDCNVRIILQPIEVRKTTTLPVGATIEMDTMSGVSVQLDVNSKEIRPLKDADIDMVLDRAVRLWPEDLLEYLNGRATP